MRPFTFTRLLALALLATGSAFGAGFSFQTIPGNGVVSAPPGATAGWGYVLTNPTSNWLELTNLSSDIMTNGTPAALFDFPILAPGETRSLAWSISSAGLFEFAWVALAPLGSTNTGIFTLEGTFWSADPLQGNATVIAAADPQSDAYTITAIDDSSAVPEPGTLGLMLIAIPIVLRSRRIVAPASGSRTTDPT